MYNWQPISSEEIKWVGVDFDLTIAQSSFPDFIPTEPLEGAVETLNKLSDMGYKIVIYTARHWADYHNIEKYCEHYGIPVRRIICGKPLFKCIIDDKNIAFRNNWHEMIDEVKKFK